MGQYQEIEAEMNRLSDIRDANNKNSSDNANARPCAVCGENAFVQKFRNVVGEVTGSMQGYFSLFGGSISGSIDGYTKTLPVLSCRKCGNEREISVWQYTYAKDIFWELMYSFYFGFEKNDPSKFKDIDSFFLERPVGTMKYMIEHENNEYKFYNEMTDWIPKTWAQAGFKISKIKVIEGHFFWKKEVEAYPSWAELFLLEKK